MQHADHQVIKQFELEWETLSIRRSSCVSLKGKRSRGNSILPSEVPLLKGESGTLDPLKPRMDPANQIDLPRKSI